MSSKVDVHKSTVITVRVPVELAARVRARAKKSTAGTTNAWLVRLLERELMRKR